MQFVCQSSQTSADFRPVLRYLTAVLAARGPGPSARRPAAGSAGVAEFWIKVGPHVAPPAQAGPIEVGNQS